jgi:hypothetical protein
MSTSVATHLEVNLRAHRARWGFVPAIDVDSARVRVETTTAPWPRVTLLTPDGRWLRVHSDRQPLDEAARVVSQSGAIADDASLVCLIGAGLGYAIEVLQAHAAATLKILVIEPEPAFVRHCLERHDWTPLFETGRLMILAGPADSGRTEAWRLVNSDGPNPIVIRHPVIAGAREAESREAMEILARAVGGARANDEARRQFAGRYLLNTLRNLPHIVHGADPDVLRGQFTGMPALIVGAGPSLDANMPAIRSVGDRALIVATDTSWRPLASAGITPALVVAADPSEVNGRHLIDVPASDDTWLLAEASVDPLALDESAGRVATFSVSDHHPWPWLRAAGFARPRVRVWGSVLTAAFDFALACGCDPILFAGADLAYTSDRPYCRGTTFERDWARHASRGLSLAHLWKSVLAGRPLLTVPSVDGRDTHTTAPLLEFRNWLLARFGEHGDRHFVNSSGAGVLFGEGITQQTLEAALAARPARDAEIRLAMRRLRPEYGNAAPDRLRLDGMLDAAIAAVARPGAVAPSGPIADWLAFGRPSLTREEIHEALVSARESLRHFPSATHSSARQASVDVHDCWPLRMPPADRVARFRALLTGEEHMLDGVTTGAPPEGRALPVVEGEVRRALDALTALSVPFTTRSEETGDSRETALSYRYAWTEAAAPIVAYLEEALLERSALTGWQPPLAPHVSTFWTHAIDRVYDEDEDVNADISADAIGGPTVRDVLLSFPPIRHSLLDDCDGGGDMTDRRHERRLNDAVLNALAEPRLRARRARANDVELLGLSAAPEPCPVRIDAVMRALTGTMVVRTPERYAEHAHRPHSVALRLSDRALAVSYEPRYEFLGDGLPRVEPLILTDHGMPPAWRCSTHPVEDLAIVTPAGSRHSILVAPDGTCTAGPVWPIEISGEHPWAGGAGALGWSNAESILMVRASPDSALLIEKVPFRPQHLVLVEQESTVWAASGGDLWEWMPGRPAALLCETPACGSVFADGDRVCLVPAVRNTQGRFVRVRMTTQLEYERQEHRLRQVPAGAAGCTTHSATRGGWTARAYGSSDLVRITGPCGEAATLACYAPFRVAWSGSSLLVSVADGGILLFRQFTNHLTGMP